MRSTGRDIEVAGRRPPPRPTGWWRQEARLETLAHACGVAPGGEGRPRLVGFVAARRGEGTSTVALQFARSLRRATGAPVLLVDAAPDEGDDGLPSLAETLGAGLPIDRAVASLADGLVVARLGGGSGGGGGPRRPGQREVWAAVRDRFAAAVVDAPALERSSDVVALAGQMDAVVVVVEAERTRTPVVEHLVGLLRHAGAPVVGTVLNKRRYHIPRFVYARL